MRRRGVLTSLCLTVAAAVPLSLSGALGAAAGNGGSGTFLTPFREDGAHYDAATNTFSGGFAKGAPTDANGCIAASASQPSNTGGPAGNPHAYDCLPAGASMVLLSNGRLAYWNALEGEEQITGTNSLLLNGGQLTVNDESRVLTLGTHGPSWVKPSPVDAGAHQTTHPDDLPLGPFSAQHYPYNNGSMFCSDQVLLADGTIIDAGGTDYYTEPYVPAANAGVIELEGVRNTRIFHPDTNTWTLGPTMNYGRWYPSLVTLGNGNLFVASGVQKLLKPVYPTHPADSGRNVVNTETLQLNGSKTWVDNGTAAQRSLPLFPRLHLLPDGHVFYNAAGQDFNPFGQSYDEATWNMAASYDPATKSWTDLGVPGADLAAQDPTQAPYAGFRGSTFDAALPLWSTGGAHPRYTSASYLAAGGLLGETPGSFVAVANSRITTVDTSQPAAETIHTVHTGDLSRGRWYGTATPLPTGQVYLTSGADVDEVDVPGAESPIQSTELFTPTLDAAHHYTGGSWAVVGDQARKRTYHNNAVLLPDGSVLIGGHAPIAADYFQTRDGVDVPGRPGTNNHHDASFQIWQPPYYSNPGRPVITGVTPHGGLLTIATTHASQIATVVLMRNTAETHLVDGDARTVVLPVVRRDAEEGTVTVALPATSDVLPNGPYMLFVNRDAKGDLSGQHPENLLPSRAAQLFVTGQSAPGIFVPQSTAQSLAAAAMTAAPLRAAHHASNHAAHHAAVATVGLVAAPAAGQVAARPDAPSALPAQRRSSRALHATRAAATAPAVTGGLAALAALGALAVARVSARRRRTLGG